MREEQGNDEELNLSNFTENDVSHNATFSVNDDTADNDINANYYEMNILNANARSMNNKIESLIEVFDEYNLTFALLTETWFKNGFKLVSELTDLECSENIGVIAKNRTARKGGGVAIAYNTTMVSLKEFVAVVFPLPSNLSLIYLNLSYIYQLTNLVIFP